MLPLGIGGVMPLFCFVHRRDDGVAYFEVLPDIDVISARAWAERLLNDRPDGVRAEIWDGDRLIHTVDHANAVAR